MRVKWPDPITLIADLVIIFVIPTLVVSTVKLYREAKKARQPQIVSHGCLEFYDFDARCAVNLVPLEEVIGIPRSGDRLVLPGDSEAKEYGAGTYEVLSVEFRYNAAPGAVDQPRSTLPAKVSVLVRRLKP